MTRTSNRKGAPMHLATLIDHRSAQAPTAPCIADDLITLDNAAMQAAVLRAASVLRAAGIGYGDVVAVSLPSQVELVVTLFAAWRLGAAVSPVNPTLSQHELSYQLRDCAARVIVTAGDLDYGIPVLTPEDLWAVITPADLGAGLPACDLPHEDESSLALLIYTSGSTGRPKGVMLDHANVLAMCTMARDAMVVTADDHSLVVLPLFHVNGIVAGTLTPLLAGGRVSLLGRFSPTSLLQRIAALRPTYFSAVPAIYALLTTLPDHTVADLSSLRVVICGAAPMTAELIGRFEARYGVPIVEGYGLSEGTCASTINPVHGLRKPGTVGLPFPGQEVRVVDADGRILPVGQAGEVLVRGANVMRGYLNLPEETARTIVDGWLRTGDVGRFDDDGYLVLTDRIKDLIIRGGENISPAEVEAALHSHPDVLEAAVVGKPDPVLGEVVVAFVSLNPGAMASDQDVLAHANRRLARYKRPVALRVLEGLPKNPVGKIDKPRLRTDLLAVTQR